MAFEVYSKVQSAKIWIRTPAEDFGQRWHARRLYTRYMRAPCSVSRALPSGIGDESPHNHKEAARLVRSLLRRHGRLPNAPARSYRSERELHLRDTTLSVFVLLRRYPCVRYRRVTTPHCYLLVERDKLEPVRASCHCNEHFTRTQPCAIFTLGVASIQMCLHVLPSSREVPASLTRQRTKRWKKMHPCGRQTAARMGTRRKWLRWL